MTTKEYIVRHSFFVLIFFLMILLSSIRSEPVFGKLDFLLLDGKLWWPSWKPLVEKILQQGDRPVYTDPVTSTILKGIFGQQTVLFRRLSLDPIFSVDSMDTLNSPEIHVVPKGVLFLLLGTNSSTWDTKTKDFFSKRDLVSEEEKIRPYRCLVNVHGFPASWVAPETHHWNPAIANTKLYYRYHNISASGMISELHRDPPDNCDVFF